ncbi:Crp/Fnr family transcriptional regulator [Kitasatospora purpeofusca]|uniref:Crp/Fnr family transcriptional regulator n=1 Tax=Kitasatospora purpeofusca TaxID=67352 RepID=UPI0035E2C14A
MLTFPDSSLWPERKFRAKLQGLYLNAGAPSVREIARRCVPPASHDTVHRTLSRPSLPRWDLVESIVRALGGDAVEFHALWVAWALASKESPKSSADHTRAEQSDIPSRKTAASKNPSLDVQSHSPARLQPGRSASPAFLASLSRDDLDAVYSRGHSRVFASGEFIYRHGDQSSHLTVIHHGFAKSSLISETGTETLLAFLGPGQVLGKLRPADTGHTAIQTLTSVHGILLTSSAFQELLHERPQVHLALMDQMIESIRHSDFSRHRATLPAEARVADALLDLSARFGAPDGVLNFPVTQQDLAKYVGISTRSCSRAFRIMRHNGIIERDGRTLAIRSADDLERIAAG